MFNDYKFWDFERSFFCDISVATANGKYTLSYGDESGTEYTYTGNITDSIYTEINTAMNNGKKDEYGNVKAVIFFKRNIPVHIIEGNFLQVSFLKKYSKQSSYYSIPVCQSETDNCFDVSISYNNPLAKSLENNTLNIFGKHCYTVFAGDEIISINQCSNNPY